MQNITGLALLTIVKSVALAERLVGRRIPVP